MLVWPATAVQAVAIVTAIAMPIGPELIPAPRGHEGPFEILADGHAGWTRDDLPATDATAHAGAPRGITYLDGHLVLVGESFTAIDENGWLRVIPHGVGRLLGVSDGFVVGERGDHLALVDPRSERERLVPKSDELSIVTVGPDGRIWFDDDPRTAGGLRVTRASALISQRPVDQPGRWPGEPVGQGVGLPFTADAGPSGPLVSSERHALEQLGDHPALLLGYAKPWCQPSNDARAFIGRAPGLEMEVQAGPSGVVWVSMSRHAPRIGEPDWTRLYRVEAGRVRVVRHPLDEAVVRLVLDGRGDPVMATKRGRVLRLSGTAEEELSDLPDPAPACRRTDLEVSW
jgi:hypothetical protein